jgi:TPR repeat protein
MVEIGGELTQGEGALDLNGAAKWFHRAAELNDPVALYNLALCYEKGRGVETDRVKALENLR